MSIVREPTAPVMAARTAAILFVFVIIFTGLLAGAYEWTRPAIEASATEEKLRLIGEVLPKGSYDNDLIKDSTALPATPELGLDSASTLYVGRLAGKPSALAFETVAPDGYAGKIRLLVALKHDGNQLAVTGVRVIAHKETPGLGDYIEPKKDAAAKRAGRPAWIEQFAGLSFVSRPQPEWKVKKDGGKFDAYSGATVTPRAIVKAVAKSLAWAEANRDRLFAATPTGAAQ